MRALLAVTLLGVAWTRVQAQQRVVAELPLPRIEPVWLQLASATVGAGKAQTLGDSEPGLQPIAKRASYWAVAASAALPGSGHLLLGERRFLPYMAFELFSWIVYATHSRDARARRDDYRGIALSVARRQFPGDRPVGDFDYYERLEHFLESGQFDGILGGEIEPEMDSTTFNGSIWFLARRTFWKDVNAPPERNTEEWQLAERFYKRRAYRDEFRWSWRNAQLEFDEYRRLIRAANDANRRAVQDLGLVIANHALSMVDSYVTIRVRRRIGGLGERTEVSVARPIGRE